MSNKQVVIYARVSSREQEREGTHPSLVSRDTFDKAQLAFLKTDKSKVRKNFDFLYPGIIKCGVCGYSFCGERQKKRNIYYRCSHFGRSCPNTCYIKENELTRSFRMHLKRIALNKDMYELVKYSLIECLGDEQEYHKREIERINTETEQCKEILKKMYLDQVNNVLDYSMWMNLKNEYEVRLSRLNAELQKHTTANTNFLDTGLKILDLCSKASLPASELSEEQVAQIVRATYLKITVNNKKVKMAFKEPFATIEQLIKLAKKEISKNELSEFQSAIISSKDKCIESIKKEPKGSDFNSSNCIYWWRLGDSNS